MSFSITNSNYNSDSVRINVTSSQHYIQLANTLERWVALQSIQIRGLGRNGCVDVNLQERMQISEVNLFSMLSRLNEYSLTGLKHNWNRAFVSHDGIRMRCIAFLEICENEIRLDSIAAGPGEAEDIEITRMIQFLSDITLRANKPLTISAASSLGALFLKKGFVHDGAWGYTLTPERVKEMKQGESL